MKRAVPYYRVSTERQGVSGLGLDAQRVSIETFAAANGFELCGQFVEIESGKKTSRPILREALDTCKREKATLLIARLDRLGRNVAFISRLMESGVDFKAVDNPHAGKLIVHIMAAFAEHERDLISERTKAALQAAKSKGVLLGKHGREVLSVENKIRADEFARFMSPVFMSLSEQGYGTIRALAAVLNEREIPTSSRTGIWHPSTVHGLLNRLKKTQTKNKKK